MRVCTLGFSFFRIASGRADMKALRVIAVLSIAWLLALPAAAKAPKLGQPAPPLTATTLDGRAFSLADARGKVVIVNFWATWCTPCRAEMPAIDAFYRAHRDEGLVVIAVSLDDPSDLPEVQRVMREFAFPAALYTQAKAGGYGRMARLPLSFVVDRDGVLRRDAWKAAPTLDAAALEREVLPLLRAPPQKS
jgi:thiol-disulfide isomerase/thioredoxin